MWKALIFSLFLIASLSPAARADDEYPACWARDLRLIEDSADQYETYLSWLERIETKEGLLDFAADYLPWREGDWIRNDRCEESIAFAWRAHREISLRAAQKALDFGLREKIDADPAVLAQYNPLRETMADGFYPERFNQALEGMRLLAKSDARQYVLSPQDGALPSCNSAELARLAPLASEYRRMLADSKTINSKMELVELARRQIRWRSAWAREDIDRSEIAMTPRDGLARLPACEEAAELLWLMHRSINDLTSGTALIYAGFGEDEHPTFTIFNSNADAVDARFAEIEAIEPDENETIREWTSCTGAQRDALKERLPAYAEFLRRDKPALTMEAVYSYFRDEVAWRRALWSSLPRCADALELALSFSQLASDQGAAFAFEMAGTPHTLNPFRGEVAIGERIIESFGAGLVGGTPFRDFPPRLPSCSAGALETLSVVLAQYHIYRERMTDFGSMGGFFAVIEPLVAWRDSLRAALPACAEAYEASLLLSQTADDYIALFGLTFAGVSHRVNPYYEAFQVGAHRLADLVAKLPLDRGPHALLWEFGGELDLCDIDEIATLSQILDEYLMLLEAGGRIDSLQALEAFGNAKIGWRRELWRQLPACAEALELGLHVYRTAGDQILFDVPAIAERQVADIIGGEAPLKTRLGEIYATLPRKWRDQHSGQIVSHRRRCTVAQRANLVEALAGYRALLEGAVDFDKASEAFPAYVDARINWRQEAAAGLPRCVIVFPLDSVLALELAESLSANIPFLGALLSGSDLLQAIASALTEGENTVQATPDYANRLPPCAEAELRGLQENYRSYSRLIDAAPDLESQPALFSFIAAKLEWRDEVWTRLPLCSEALELGFLIHQVASDMAAGSALALRDLEGETNPYIEHEMLSRDALRGTLEKIDGLIEGGARQGAPATADMPLPRCADGDFDILAGYTYDNDLFPILDGRPLAMLLEYVNRVLSLRAETWAPLPACVEAYILGDLSTRQASDFAAYIALDWLDVPRAENPFMPGIQADAKALVEFTQLLRRFDFAGIDRFVEAHWARG